MLKIVPFEPLRGKKVSAKGIYQDAMWSSDGHLIKPGCYALGERSAEGELATIQAPGGDARLPGGHIGVNSLMIDQVITLLETLING